MKLFILISLMFSLPIQINTVNYNYSYYGEVIHSAPGMTYATYFNAQTLGTKLSSPEDLVVFENDIYLIDSVENKLMVVTSDFELKTMPGTADPSDPTSVDKKGVFEEFKYAQSFLDKMGASFTETVTTLKGASGLEVTDKAIYIADTGNFRILKLNKAFEVTDIFDFIDDPTFDKIDETTPNKIKFEPRKITVDVTDRMYVVAKNVYEGILELGADGEFNRFTGVNPVSLTPFEIFRRSLMTEIQLAQLKLFLPTEYTNVTINDRGFIYSTSRPTENNAKNTIQLINPKGVDVIKRNGYHPPMGDVQFVEGSNNHVITGPSLLVDIAYTDHGIFTVLDQKRSRLFTYDSEGNLLYVNGDEGQQSDKFSEGSALGYLNDDLLVLDRKSRTVIVYRLTEFGRSVNQAIAFHDLGKFDEAAEIWQEVLVLNTNYEIAYNGIGKFLLRDGQFKEAMNYFKLGHDDYYYSKAFKEYRNEIIRDNFGWIMGSIVVLAGGLIFLKVRKTIKTGGSILYED